MATRFENFLKRLHAHELLLGDGAWTTQMQKLGLQLGDCPEEWNLSHPDEIGNIAREYFLAGCDFCLANTFGGNKFRLVRHGFAAQVHALNVAGARLSHAVAEEFGGMVAASVGPTGEFLQPEGMLTRQEMHAAFAQQMGALKEGGADCVLIETMYVLDEALLAVQVAAEVGLPCMVSMTFENTPAGFQTMPGVPLREAIAALDQTSAEVIGTNCGNGVQEMVKLAAQIKALTRKPVLVKPNASLREDAAHNVTYLETPELIAASVPALAAAGISVLGGCCGTTPAHIRAFRREIDLLKQKTEAPAKHTKHTKHTKRTTEN